jgi:hypothetical protein
MKRFLIVLLYCSVAVAQLVTEHPISSEAMLLEAMRGANELTIVAPSVSSAVAGFLLNPWNYGYATFVTNPEGVSSMKRFCGTSWWIFNRVRILSVPRVPPTATVVIRRGEVTVVVQGPLVIGEAGVTRLLEGDPMVRNLANQMLTPLLREAVLHRAC